MNFSERKDIEFCCVQINGDILTLNFSLQYAKRQSKQHPCEHLLHESLVGQREYTTQTKGSFKGIVLCLPLSFRYLVELEPFQSLKMKLSGLKYG